MIQLNLLPDVKKEFIKAQRKKRTVIFAAVAVSSVCLLVATLLFITVHVVQKKRISDLDKRIDQYSKDLKKIENLDRILTVQNQLRNLNSLHDARPDTTRLIGFMRSVTPAQVSISKLKVDYTTNTMTISGDAINLEAVNRFVDTLKFTSYSVKEPESTGKAYSDVVMTSFARTDKGATYDIQLLFDKVLFDQKSEVTLTVPKGLVTTRSELSKPDALFMQSKEEEQ